MPELHEVNVTFAIEPVEAAAIDYGATRVVGPRAFWILAHQDGRYELELIYREAGSVDDCRTLAIRQWDDIRMEANLPPTPAIVTGAWNVSGVEPVEMRFIDDT